MKLLKLPACPHCGTKYGYSEVSHMSSREQICCYCKKKFIPQKKAGRMIILLIACCMMIIFNLIIFFTTKSLSLTGFVLIAVCDAVVISAAVLLFPLTVRFRPLKMTKSEKKSSDNKKAHSKRR